VEALFCICSTIRRLVAYECKEVALLSFFKSDVLDITILLEQLSDVTLIPSDREVFDKEIASLL